MKFSKITKEADTKHVIQCDDMDENTLIRRMPDEVVDKKAVSIKEGQYAILYKAGKVYDAVHKPGMYEIEASKQSKSRKEMEKWRNFVPPKADDSKLCVIYFNMKEIENNSFSIEKPISYIDWTKKTPLKAEFTCKRKV